MSQTFRLSLEVDPHSAATDVLAADPDTALSVLSGCAPRLCGLFPDRGMMTPNHMDGPFYMDSQ